MADVAADRLGATVAEWRLWGHYLGLERDLLPVVSNPRAPIDPKSKLAALGKVPSIYNSRGLVAGIARWPEAHATRAHIRSWAQQPDYGICLQTRSVRAIDIDIDDDALAVEMLTRFETGLGIRPPVRRRGARGRCLLLLRVVDEAGEDVDLCKRVMRLPQHVPGEGSALVELLATGQQCVVAGTHSSGQRYDWLWPTAPTAQSGLEDCIPAVSLERLDSVWHSIAEACGAVDWHARPRRRGETIPNADDPVAAWLLSDDCEWHVHGQSRDGTRIFVRCPWEEGHSTAGDETSSAWLVAGTSGYERGHYRCLHATCASRTRDEFLRAAGYIGSRFAAQVEPGEGPGWEIAGLRPVVVGSSEAPGAAPALGDLVDVEQVDALPAFERHPKTGVPLPTVRNYLVALLDPRYTGDDWALDEFTGDLTIREGADRWRLWTDGDYVRLQTRLERAGLPNPGVPALRQYLDGACLSPLRRVNHLADWLAGLRWDGVERIERFLTDCAGAEDGAYTRAVSVYLWTAMAGRALADGVKADMVPVLISREGTGKSSLVRALAPWPNAAGSISFATSEADIARTGRGKVVRELEELRGLRSRDAETIKAWVTTTVDEWVPKYKEASVLRPRRWIVIGTTNDEQFLDSGAVNRRWLPVHVDRDGTNLPWQAAQRLHNEPGLRDQLWAEAITRYQLDGVAYEAANRLAAQHRAAAEVTDVVLAALLEWLLFEDEPGVARWQRPLSYVEIATGVAQLLPRGARMSDHRLSNLLHTLRFQQQRARASGGGRPRRYVATPATPAALARALQHGAADDGGAE